MTRESYSTQEVMKLLGFTARQMQWSREHGIVKPKIRGRRGARRGRYNPHRYLRSQLFEMALLAVLRRRGLGLSKVHRLLRLVFVDLERGYGFIVTDGQALKVADTPDHVVEEAVKFQRGVHVIDLADLRKRVKL